MSVAREQTRESNPDCAQNDASWLMINIVRPSQAWQPMPAVDQVIRNALNTLAAQLDIMAVTQSDLIHQGVTVVLSDDGEIQKLNQAHRGVDKATNVLSFPSLDVPGYEGDDQVGYLGDIVLAFETIDREAKSQGCAIQDHVSHLTIHGFLHLLGYDHDTDDRAAKMECLEVAVLAELGIANPYQDIDPKTET